MRKSTRDDIMSLIPTILEGIKYVLDYSMNLDIVQNIIQDCCNAFISIANSLKTNLSHESFIVYNVLIEELYNDIKILKNSIYNKVNFEEISQKFFCDLDKLTIQLKNEKEVKIEMLFLPYKASMWDSLESVWESAEKSEYINANVMPIPYYDKNLDGTLKDMYYEGDKFPKHIPIIDWNEYDLDRYRPDIVFIHNPYDDNNRITSVHPKFYTMNLKKITNMLVYIPYFVLGDNIYEHFCVSHGTIFSDKTIVQSDRAKEVYTKCFRAMVRNNKLEDIFNDYVIENKFMSLGSPKIDKAINSKKEEFFLPREWKEKICDKKVVLYNTGLSALLEGKMQQLDKMEDVLLSFKGRKDVVLWWRPHPLTDAVNIAMHPELINRYEKIINRYIKDGFGILDNSDDLYRAIYYTDMYYGDDSSLVHLYGVKGKPIMIQNRFVLLNKKIKNEDRSIYFYDCAYEGNELWFVAGNYNGLYKMDISSGKVEYIGRVPDEDVISNSLYANIFKIRDDIWMIPSRAKEIARYNLKENKFHKIKLSNFKISKTAKFNSAHVYKNKIYMIPWNFEGIVCLDLDNESVTVDSRFIKLLEEKYGYKEKMSYVHKSCLVDKYIYMPIYNTNIIIEYNLMTKKIKDYQIGDESLKFGSIVYDGNNFWLIPRTNGPIVSWDKKNNKFSVYNKYPKGFSCTNLFRFAHYTDGNVWLFPEMGNMIIKLDVKTGSMEGICKTNGKYYCSFARDINNSILTISSVGRKNTQLLIIDKSGEIIKKEKVECLTKINFKEENIFDCLKDAHYDMASEYYLYESVEGNIERALNVLGNEYFFEEEKEKYLSLYSNTESGCGKAVIDMCIDEMRI